MTFFFFFLFFLPPQGGSVVETHKLRAFFFFFGFFFALEFLAGSCGIPSQEKNRLRSKEVGQDVVGFFFVLFLYIALMYAGPETNSATRTATPVLAQGRHRQVRPGACGGMHIRQASHYHRLFDIVAQTEMRAASANVKGCRGTTTSSQFFLATTRGVKTMGDRFPKKTPLFFFWFLFCVGFWYWVSVGDDTDQKRSSALFFCFVFFFVLLAVIGKLSYRYAILDLSGLDALFFLLFSSSLIPFGSKHRLPEWLHLEMQNVPSRSKPETFFFFL